MLYTLTSPADQSDRIRLYPSYEAALANSHAPADVTRVAVQFDWRMRRVVPCWTDPSCFNPLWSTPAQAHADGSVTAKGPIPESLFEVSSPTGSNFAAFTI